MRYILSLSTIAVLLTGCSNSSTTSLNPGTTPSTAIHGTLWTTDWDKLNTFNGYYVQDADIPEARDSIALTFTPSEQARIEGVADSTGFWALPEDVPVLLGQGIKPNPGRTTIRIKSESRDHTISWDGMLATGFATPIFRLEDTISAILHARPEYQELPPAALRD